MVVSCHQRDDSVVSKRAASQN